MIAEQSIEMVTSDSLLSRAKSLRDQGYRVVQIGATRFPEVVELTYSFDLHGQMHSLRLTVPGAAARVPSISGIFGCAVLYENEIHDLFNVQVDGLALDFHGNLYKTAVKFPFGSTKPPVVAQAPAKPPSSPEKPV